MATYSLIIKNILKTENNFFSPNYKNDNINGVIKILFNQFKDEKIINIKNKYNFFYKSLNNFYIKGKKEEEFIYFFNKVQKTYKSLITMF